MIEGIRFLNFQGFKGDQRIELGDINLLFGPNSAGKSSIARGLQLMSQSLRGYQSESRILMPVFDGHQINSRPETLLFGRGLDPSLELGFGVLLDTPVNAKAWFSIVLKPDGQVVNQYQFLPSGNEMPFAVSFELRLEPGEETKELGLFIAQESELALIDWFRKFGDPARLISTVRSSIFENLDAHYKTVYPELHAAIVASCGADIFHMADEFHEDHGVFQIAFQKYYEMAVAEFDHVPGDVYWDLDAFVNPTKVLFRLFLNYVIDETLSSATHDLADLEIVDPVRVIPDNLNSFDVFEEATIEAISENLLYLTEGRYSVDQVEYLIQDQIDHRWEVNDHFTGISSGLENVGQGITQILEVLVVLELADGLLVLQQPDLHLHPKAVGRLSDLIYRNVSRDVFSTKRLIVETHSESLLMRLQKHRRLSIEHEDLTSSDISLKVFYSEAIPPVEVTPELIQEFVDSSGPLELIDQLNEHVGNNLDLLMLDWSEISNISSETRSLLCESLGYNQISTLRVDHLGDVLDPFPVSFADLRIQDLLQ